MSKPNRPAVEVQRSGRVPAPIERVWAVVSDAARAPDWFSFADRTEVRSGSGLGEQRTQHGRWGAKRSEIDQEVVEYDPPRVIAWKHTAERLNGKPAPSYAASAVFRIELEPDGPDATVVRLRTLQQPRSAATGFVMRWAGARELARRMEESLTRLLGAVD
ncbi:SRPBCC family protein [Actinokineospora auranticolor]|uniref:Polyketide cyclase/dehydrase/lipid transport protein n=1 Tax=Actinokineospora auranticolor TaxID=155976 RepID=A0A2S6GUR9_9PSEU|nr:SRPBCC family protein [Actinokineospora auranticolor]PPK68939.1 polyketide cyclase/dehydrase/lipid transport protein [Actinokineospora auranticolor]